MTAGQAIRIAHFSDLHYGPKNLAEADRCLAAAIDQAIGEQVHAVVISGDSTDHALDLHSPAAVRLGAQIRRLADHCPVLLLQGTYSHEPPGTLVMFGLLGGRFGVHVADRIQQVGLTMDGRWTGSSGWRFEQWPANLRALFTCLPTVNKAVVAAAAGATGAAEGVGEHLAELLRAFAPSHQAARMRGVPTIGVSHGTVFGCLSEHGVPMAAFDHEFTAGALFASQAQAFMLGHIHRHQAWRCDGAAGRQCIAYPGSIGRFHYGEEGDKGFLIWEVGASGSDCTLVPTPARHTIDIVFDGKAGLNGLQAATAGKDIQGAFVRVRWTVAEEDRESVDRAAMLRHLSGAAEVKLEGRVVPVARTRCAGIAQSRSLAEKIKAWAALTSCNPQPLLARLATLSSESADSVVAGILSSARPGSASDEVVPDALLHQAAEVATER